MLELKGGLTSTFVPEMPVKDSKFNVLADSPDMVARVMRRERIQAESTDYHLASALLNSDLTYKPLYEEAIYSRLFEEMGIEFHSLESTYVTGYLEMRSLIDYQRRTEANLVIPESIRPDRTHEDSYILTDYIIGGKNVARDEYIRQKMPWLVHDYQVAHQFDMDMKMDELIQLRSRLYEPEKLEKAARVALNQISVPTIVNEVDMKIKQAEAEIERRTEEFIGEKNATGIPFWLFWALYWEPSVVSSKARNSSVNE